MTAAQAYSDPARARRPDPVPGEGRVRVRFSEDARTAPSTCTFRAFGTVVELGAYGPADSCCAVFGEAVGRCRDYERRLSTRLPQSDVARLNAAAGAACAVHADTAWLLEAAKRYCELSRGTFDITVQPAVKLWDFERGCVPDGAALAEAVRHVDWRGVRVFERAGQWFAQLDDPAAEVDLGGIAKGWIADRLVELLGEPDWGITGFSVNLGGNVAVGGAKPDGAPWAVGVRDPRCPAQAIATAQVDASAVVTSGTYERCFCRGGVLYHHVLDPRTGMPAATDLASATVVAARALDAEGFSTTLLALGIARAAELAREEEAIASAVLVDAEGRVVVAG